MPVPFSQPLRNPRISPVESAIVELRPIFNPPLAELFRFPVAAQFLPPIAGIQSLVVVSDQEHRLAAINAAISTDMLQPPLIVTKVALLQ